MCWKRNESCVCNAAEKDDDKEEMGDSVDLYGEVEEPNYRMGKKEVRNGASWKA